MSTNGRRRESTCERGEWAAGPVTWRSKVRDTSRRSTSGGVAPPAFDDGRGRDRSTKPYATWGLVLTGVEIALTPRVSVDIIASVERVGGSETVDRRYELLVR